jgi:hypothetical protein
VGSEVLAYTLSRVQLMKIGITCFRTERERRRAAPAAPSAPSPAAQWPMAPTLAYLPAWSEKYIRSISSRPPNEIESLVIGLVDVTPKNRGSIRPKVCSVAVEMPFTSTVKVSALPYVPTSNPSAELPSEHDRL